MLVIPYSFLCMSNPSLLCLAVFEANGSNYIVIQTLQAIHYPALHQGQNTTLVAITGNININCVLEMHKRNLFHTLATGY